MARGSATPDFRVPEHEGCLLTQPAGAVSGNCLTAALAAARSGADDIVFLIPHGSEGHEGHVVLRDRGTGTVREAGPAAGAPEHDLEAYAAGHGFVALGALPSAELLAFVALPVAARAAAAARAGGTLATVAHRRFGIAGYMPIYIPPTPAPPPGGSSTDSQDHHVNDWLDALGGSVSQSDKDALKQTADDAQTLKSWFDSHKRGDPALNDMPQNVSDAENRLLSTPSVSQQIHAGDLVTRDALGKFIGSLDDAADSAKSSFQSFQKNNKSADAGEVGAAAQASILQADLPILDASSNAAAKVDGTFNLDDLKAIATSGDSGVPDPLKKAAQAYTNQASFDTLSEAGKAGTGLVDSDGLGKVISDGVGFSHQDSAVHDWVADLGDAVSDDDKKSLEQVGDDATTLKSWFDAHGRGDPALNDMPQNVADAESRLLDNPAISKQIHVGDLITRDAVGKFLGSLDDSAKSATKDWDSFKGSDNAGDPVTKQMAADADILRANMPVMDAAGSASNTDGMINTDDLKAVASGDGSKGLPTALTNAAKLFGNQGMFHLFDASGDNLATTHDDGLADTGNLDNFIGKQAGTISSATLGQTLSEAADRSMTAGVDTSKLGPDVFANPQNYTGAQKAAMIQKLQDLDTEVQVGKAQDNWVGTLIAGTGLNPDHKQVEADIAQKIAQLGGDKDVQQFRKDTYDTSLQSIVGADPALNSKLQSFYDGDLQNGKALTDALDAKDSSGNTISAEDGLQSFMQTASVLNVGLGQGGKALPALDLQSIAQKSGQVDTLKKAYEDDILSGKNLKSDIDTGVNLTTAVQQFQVDAANFGAVLPTDYISGNASKLQQTFSDTVTNGVLDYATGDDVGAAFLDKDGNLDTGKLTDAITQAVKQDPDLGKTSDGTPISTPQVVSLVGQVVNEVRQGVKLQDAIEKIFKANDTNLPSNGGPGKPSGAAADAYNRGVLHLVSAALTGGVVAAREAGSSGNGSGTIDAARLGAGMQISGALLEAGSKYLKDTKSSIIPSEKLPTIENAGKVLGGAGGAIGGVLGIFSGVQSIKDGDAAGGAYGITNGVTGLLGGVASATEGGIGLVGADVTGEAIPAIAASVSAGLGVGAGIIGVLSSVAMGLYTGISAAIKNVDFTHHITADAEALGVTGGSEDSNDVDVDDNSSTDNSPPP